MPELAILDIRLPNASGIEVASWLRRSPKLRNIGILLTTAYHLTHNQENEAIALSAADRLVYKPLPMGDELRLILEDIIRERQLKA